MNTESIVLPRTLVNQILRHAQRAKSLEVCGLIGARDGRPVHCYPVANVAEQPARRFAMDPQGQLDALRQMRERDETLWAIYHSHPDEPAIPSATDIEESQYPDVLYLIVSLNTKGVLELRGFRMRTGEPEAVDLTIE
ncbi:MAG: CysO-cysteine peptidase [Gammaproteobacteria bacterium]